MEQVEQTKTQKTNRIDMLHGTLLDKLLIFALPLAASSILQQLFNAVDVAVVGRFTSSQAQAAVGCNGPVINLLINLFVGISVGANVVIASYIGQQKTKEIKAAVHTALVVAISSGFFLLILGMFIARPILTLMNTPADVMEYAILYLRIYFTGMPFIMFYNFGSAILRSIGDTKRPLYCLIVSGVINAGLNLFLVIAFDMGVAGVAIATVISNIISACMIFYFLTHEKGAIRFEWRSLSISKPELKRILQIGIPAGLQSVVFSLSNVFIQTALNGYGSDAVAGSAVALNYEYFTYFVISAFNQATVTFISQNFGAGQFDRCKKIFRLSMTTSILITFCMSMIFIAGHKFFISLFTAEIAVTEYAMIRMLNVLTFNCLASTYEIGGAALRGMGYSMLPAVLTIFGTCVFRLLWIYTVCRRFHGFAILMRVYPISWVITGTAVLISYFVLRKRTFATYLS